MSSQTLHSLQELGQAMEKPKKFTKAPPETCEPVNIRLLSEVAGTHEKAGRMIGISGSHISACLKANETKVTYDLAAKAVLMGMEREKARPAFYFVEVHSAQKEVFDTFLRGLGLKATTL